MEGALKLIVIIPVKRKLAQVALVMDNRRLHDLSKLSSLNYPISTQFDTKSNYRGGLAWWAVAITIPSMRGSQVTETVGTPHWNREREREFPDSEIINYHSIGSNSPSCIILCS